MTTPTIRDHCAALATDVSYLLMCIRDGSSDPITLQEVAARAALAAEPAGEVPIGCSTEAQGYLEGAE
jgi:hypothetical protein